MDKLEIYKQLLEELSIGLHLLEDKPDETPASTLGALWLTASGQPSSTNELSEGELPDLCQTEKDELVRYIQRRIEGEPLAHITERQVFLEIEFIAGSGALIPRKETELLANAALDEIKYILNKKDRPLIIDICTGAGNLAITYAKHFSQATVFAGDLSTDAVELAKKNVLFHHLEDRVKIYQSDLLESFDNEQFHHNVDLITCNPPYISSGKVKEMDDEISAFEPKLAFDGGPFGIKILKRLIHEAPAYLNSHGCLMFEVGLGQGDAITRLINKSKDFTKTTAVYDSNEQIRAIKAYL